MLKIYNKEQRRKNNKPRAAITIQKWVRGFLQRKEFIRIKNNFRRIRKLRRFLSVGYKKIKSKFLRDIIFITKQAARFSKKERETLLKKFRNFSATTIQKNFKGYMVRKYVVAEVIEYHEAQKRAVALLKGWQIRKIVS